MTDIDTPSPVSPSPGQVRTVTITSLSELIVLVGRFVRTNAQAMVAVLLIVIGLGAAWLEPALSRPVHAFSLGVVLPGTGHQDVLSWGLVLSVAAVLAIVAMTPWGRPRQLISDLAAVLGLAATVGFLIQSATVDRVLQVNLRHNNVELAQLQRLVGYNIPRPAITTLGPIPLSESAADIGSALRFGFYLALAGAVLLVISALSHRRAVRSPRRTTDTALRVTAAVTVLLILATTLQSGLASWMVGRAATSAGEGDDNAAVSHYQTALSLDSDLRSSADVLAALGMSQLRTGTADGPAAQLAQSRLRLQAGKDLAALQLVAAGALRWPDQAAVHQEFDDQALAYLVKHATPQPVKDLVTVDNDSALLRLALAKFELRVGDNPAAMDDARIAADLADDDDMRSAALTFLSIAQNRAGDLVTSRSTLLAAVDADEEYVNVMAHSLLTGLYTTLPS